MKPSVLKKVYELVLPATESADGRLAIENAQRPLLRKVANPLLLGDMGNDATYFVLGQHWKTHFARKAAETGSPVDVKHLRDWIDDPRPMGLPQDAENLVILVFAAQSGYTVYRHGGPHEMTTLQTLPDDCELRKVNLPDAAVWEPAVTRAGSIFGIAGHKVLSAGNVSAALGRGQKKAEGARRGCETFRQKLHDRMACMGLAPESTNRMKTALATQKLVGLVVAAEPANVIGLLARAEIATSEAAMGECVEKAAELEGNLETAGWEVFEAIGQLADDRKTAAAEILADVRKALAADEHVMSLAGAQGGTRPSGAAFDKACAATATAGCTDRWPNASGHTAGCSFGGQRQKDRGPGFQARSAARQGEAGAFGSRGKAETRANRPCQRELGYRGGWCIVSTASPTFSQIKTRVATIRQKIANARVIGIHSLGRWTDEVRKTDGDHSYLIRQCDSPLAMRLALREPVEENTIKILITPLENKELSDDIRMRMVKPYLFEIKPWEIARTLFQAQTVDPRLSHCGWIAEMLLDMVPAEGYPAARGGFLDADTVWPLLLRHGIGLTADTPDLTSLLKWSLDAEATARFRRAAAAFREAATVWLAEKAGPVVEIVLSCVSRLERPDAVPLGLAVGVVYHPAAAGKLDRASGKLEERFLGSDKPLEATVVQRWSTAAIEAVRALRHTDPRRMADAPACRRDSDRGAGRGLRLPEQRVAHRLRPTSGPLWPVPEHRAGRRFAPLSLWERGRG